MAGTIVVDRIESDASYTSTINVAGQITFSNTVNFGAYSGTAPVAGFYLPTTNNLAFTTASTERVRIDNQGNVGIGTSSPSTYGLLSVVSSTAGSAKISIQDTSGGASPAPLVQFGVNSSNGFNTSDAARVWTTAPSSSTASLNFAAYNGGAPSTAQMVLTGGNVLLSNNQYFGVKDTTGAAVGFPIFTGSNDAIFGYLASGTTGISTYQFRTGNNVERMRIDSSGVVGLSTASGTPRFEVVGITDSNNQGVRLSGSGDNTLQHLSATSNTLNFQQYYSSAWRTVAQIVGNSTADFKFNSGYGSAATAYGCRAWVNFNGTGTVAIRASGNVTSITDNGVGDYTVNFTNAMPDANYSWGYSSQYTNSGAVARQNIFPMMQDGASQVLSTSLRFYTGTTAALYDSAIISVQFFR